MVALDPPSNINVAKLVYKTSTVDANENATIFAHLSQTQHASSEAELACMHS